MTIYPIFFVLVATAVCSAAGYLSTSQPPRKLQPDKDQDDPSIYWDECWVDLPPDVQAGYITLGYTEDLWTNAGVTEYDDYDYWMLPKEQKEAAISLGITEEIWCNDPDTGENGCFVLEADIPPEFATLPVDDYDWWEIPDGLKEVLLANEYSEETWCNDPVTGESGCLVLETDIPPEFVSQYWGDSDWVELPDELKEALLSAGLHEESWCSDPETGENGCSVLEADITPSPTTSSPTIEPSSEPSTEPTTAPVTSSPTDNPTPKPVSTMSPDVAEALDNLFSSKETTSTTTEATTTYEATTTITETTSEPSLSPTDKPKTNEPSVYPTEKPTSSEPTSVNLSTLSPTISPSEKLETSTETTETTSTLAPDGEPDTSTETTETTSTLAPVEPDTNKDEEPSAAEKVPEPSDAAVGLSLCMITTFVATVSVSIWY